MNSLGNKILLAVMTGDRHGSGIDHIHERLLANWSLSIVAGRPVAVFNPVLALHQVRDEVIALEQAGLLQMVSGGLNRITERGLRHVVSILTVRTIADTGDDLGDIADHLLTPIPIMQMWGNA